jgi:Zn-dependent peptidase ImmA (M78 family)
MVLPSDPSQDIVSVLRQLGLVVAVRELGAGGVDGIYVSGKGGGVVVLNGSKSPHRLRRTAAHLLAHQVYGDEPHVDRDIDEPPDDPVQCRANTFATRFLARNPTTAADAAPGEASLAPTSSSRTRSSPATPPGSGPSGRIRPA